MPNKVEEDEGAGGTNANQDPKQHCSRGAVVPHDIHRVLNNAPDSSPRRVRLTPEVVTAAQVPQRVDGIEIQQFAQFIQELA
jgi:hypothetical protein